MSAIIFCVIIFASSALSRNVPDFRDLDEEDQMLYRAAYDPYDAPSYPDTSYNYDSYNNYDNEIPTTKLDLLKDGLWALKAKMKELKAFNKALAANLLLTKIQVKELLAHGIKPMKKHQHMDVDPKPYNYQLPLQPSYPQHEQPHPQYPAPAPQYTHSISEPQYSAPTQQYSTSGSAPASAPQYSAPAPQYSSKHYAAPQQLHDPYYGH